MERVPLRLRDTSAAILLMALMVISGQRLYATDWTDGLGAVMIFCLLGALVGLLLGMSRFNRFVTFLLGTAYSLSLVPLITLWNLFKNVPWGDRLPILSNQIAVSAVEIFTGQPVLNPIIYVVFAYVMYWFISLAAGYAVARYGKFAGAVVPAGLALIIIQLFDMREGDRVYILAVYVFLSLLLLGRLNYLRKRSLWKESRVWVSGEAITDMNIFIGAAAVGLVMLAWVAPVSGKPVTSARILWENITRPIRQRQEDLNKTIQSLQSRQSGTIEIYGDSLTLGHQAATSSDVFAEIRAPLIGGAERYYWRVRTYDLYQNDQWYSDYAFDEPFLPSEGSIAIADPQGITAEFAFTIPNQNLSTMVTPSRPVWTNRPSRLTFTPSTPGKIDPLMFLARPTIISGQEYLVHANVFKPNMTDLRAAGVDYPAWVSDHYLELPGDLPPEITALARQITAGQATPFDKAEAITDYLRTNIKYSTIIGTPPAGKDLLSWFLFDVKTGFCNYYATAEVVLLRSVGIPARMVVGYAQGEFEAPNQYTIRDKDAHAWPEVYFPGNGWVEFEPTASQPALVRPLRAEVVAGPVPTPVTSGTPGANNPDNPIPLGGSPAAGAGNNSLLRLTTFFLSGLLIIGLLFAAYFFGIFDKIMAYFRRTFEKPVPVVIKNELEELGLNVPHWLSRWAYLAGLTPAEKAFTSVYRSLHWLGVKNSPAQTPSEAAAALSRAVPSISGDIHALLEQYERSLYGQETADISLVRQAAEAIRKIALRASIQVRLKAFGVLLRQGLRSNDRADVP